MFKALSKSEFLELAKKDSRIAVYKEVPADLLTPAGVFQAVSGESEGSSLLESFPETGESQYSFIGIDPVAIFQSQGKNITLKEKGNSRTFQQDPVQALREAMQRYSCKNLNPSYSFTGGAVGFASYDSVRLYENIPDQFADQTEMPDFFFHFYEKMIAFDHKRERALFLVAVEVGGDPDKAYQAGLSKIDALIEKASKEPEGKIEMNKPSSSVQEETVDCDDETYKKMVQKAKEYIIKGDIFQVVLSRTFQKKFSVKPFQIYRALRLTSPSPYMFFIDAKDFQVVGASPEMLVQVKNGTVSTMPIAGTRPRGKTPEEDAALEKELLKDDKEQAEHVMLVDLGRNDVGAVSKAGTVEVKEFKTVQRFSHVMHIVSRVVGQKKENCDAFDALRAIFPAGTLSGAPKVRAMEIIDELEKSKRGLYGGAIITIDAEGNLISCIAIRMAVLRNGIARVRAGGGLVYDSDPQTEANETRHKAKNVLNAIRLAEGELS